MPSVLIIDDDEQVRCLLREAFEQAGYEVAAAANGAEGIQLYKQDPTDIVILDILMPEKEGLETILDLKREFPAVKVIAISGGSERARIDVLDLAKRLGAKHTLTKPFELRTLLTLASEMLSPSR
ncbi:MAG: response regulator [Nitrospirae bacterium]|nr:MAG: response regulator [Nitrospirota bacterium]